MKAAALLAFAMAVAAGQADEWRTHHDAARRALTERKYDVAGKEARAGFDAARAVRESRDERAAHIEALARDRRGTGR